MIELVVERNPGETRIAVREDGRTTDLMLERRTALSLVGAIFSARVVRIEPDVGAFLDIGRERAAFLPHGKGFPTEGQAVLVQVTKDQHGEKGPEVTRAVVIDGGPLALTPSEPGIAVSRNLPNSVRNTIKSMLERITGSRKPSPGVLVRSSVWGRADKLEEPWTALIAEWHRIEERRKGRPPLLLRPPPDPILHHIRRFQPERAVVGDAGTAAKLKSLLPDRVELVARPFEAQSVEDDLARAFAREIPIPGGRLVVDEGEALTAIDVDGTGDRGALCLAAASEVARVIRLRDIGGLIVVDFPFFEGRHLLKQVDEAMDRATLGDPRPVECLGWTRGGLYEMTRSRSGPSVTRRLFESSTSPTIESAALAALRALARAEGGRLRLIASPEVIGWLEGAGAAALAEAGRAVALEAEPGYARDRFDMVRN